MPVKTANKSGKRRLRIKSPRFQTKNSGCSYIIGSNLNIAKKHVQSGIGEMKPEKNCVPHEQLYQQADRYRILFEAIFEAIVIHQNGLISDVNSVFENMFGYSREELLGTPVLIIAAPESQDLMAQNIKSSFQKPYEAIGIRKDRSTLVLEINAKEYLYNGNRIRMAAIRDITSHRRIEEDLKSAYERLETEQTALREKNTALKELMNQIEGEKAIIRKRIQTNVDRILLPIFKKLKTRIGIEEQTYVTLLENTLNEITSPFINQLERSFAVLTPREVELCNMMKNGYSSKDIAASLHTCVQTVLKQRKAIRRKMGIANQSINLVTFLKAI